MYMYRLITNKHIYIYIAKLYSLNNPRADFLERKLRKSISAGVRVSFWAVG